MQKKKNAQKKEPLSVYGPEVYFDLETTGLGGCHIIQLAAITDDQKTFNQYVKPKISIHPVAYKITGLTFKNGEMYLKGNRVESVSITTCIKDFINFLRASANNERCVLVAHNATVFDSIHLVKAAASVGCLQELQTVVLGFLDTLPLFKSICPGFPKHTLTFLVKEILKEEFDAHKALCDAEALQKLVRKSSISLKSKLTQSFSISYTIESQGLGEQSVKAIEELDKTDNQTTNKKRFSKKLVNAESSMKSSHVSEIHTMDNHHHHLLSRCITRVGISVVVSICVLGAILYCRMPFLTQTEL